MTRRITAIIARATNGVIGRDGGMPWRIPADLRRFKTLTLRTDGAEGIDAGPAPMIMGRKTFESFPRPLTGRRHIVLTRDRAWHADGAEAAYSSDEALALAGAGDISVIGGAEIYSLMLPLTTHVELTEVHGDFPGDTHMAAFGGEWHEIARIDHAAQGDTPAYSFVTLERVV